MPNGKLIPKLKVQMSNQVQSDTKCHPGAKPEGRSDRISRRSYQSLAPLAPSRMTEKKNPKFKCQMSNQVQNPNVKKMQMSKKYKIQDTKPLSLQGANGVSDEAIPHIRIAYCVFRMGLLRSPAARSQ